MSNRRILLGGVAAVLAALGLFWFRPWTLWVDQAADESFPVAIPASAGSTRASAAPSPAPSPALSSAPSPALSSAPRPARPVLVSRGRLVSHEHRTTGAVGLYRTATGGHVLRISGLDTSNGPDLKVWLTDAPVLKGRRGWFVFDDGAYVDLGSLRANQGNLVYPVPAGTDLDKLTSLSIWCARFHVSFGAAALARA